MIRSALRVMDGNRIPGVIDEELFASLVLVAEHHVQTTAPAMVEFAEAAVAEALGMVSVGIPPTGVAASGDGWIATPDEGAQSPAWADGFRSAAGDVRTASLPAGPHPSFPAAAN